MAPVKLSAASVEIRYISEWIDQTFHRFLWEENLSISPDEKILNKNTPPTKENIRQETQTAADLNRRLGCFCYTLSFDNLFQNQLLKKVAWYNKIRFSVTSSWVTRSSGSDVQLHNWVVAVHYVSDRLSPNAFNSRMGCNLDCFHSWYKLFAFRTLKFVWKKCGKNTLVLRSKWKHLNCSAGVHERAKCFRNSDALKHCLAASQGISKKAFCVYCMWIWKSNFLCEKWLIHRVFAREREYTGVFHVKKNAAENSREFVSWPRERSEQCCPPKS